MQLHVIYQLCEILHVAMPLWEPKSDSADDRRT
jgi:hypothetical protein